MTLSDENITSFQALYKANFGKDISRQEAFDKGMRLLILMKLVYKPMTQEQYDAIQKHMHDTKPILLKRLQNHEPRIHFDQGPVGQSEGENISA